MASQSPVEFEKDSNMDVGALHENEKSVPWMSELFEKLDLEVDEEDLCSTDKRTKNDAHSLKKNEACQKLGIDSFEDLCSTNTTLPVFHSRPLIGARYVVSDEEAKEYYSTKRRLTYRRRRQTDMERMMEECLLAFRNYVQNISLEDTAHRFGELRSHCVPVHVQGKIYQHFNFIIETKLRNSDIWTPKLYFAEVKQLSSVKYYFCCPLEENDCGDCYECEKQQLVYGLQHPRCGGYENGYSIINFDPCMVDYSSDSDTAREEVSSSDSDRDEDELSTYHHQCLKIIGSCT